MVKIMGAADLLAAFALVSYLANVRPPWEIVAVLIVILIVKGLMSLFSPKY